MDDINRKMEFIIEQQAQFAAHIQQIREQHKDFLHGIEELKDQHRDFLGELQQMLGLIGGLAAAQENTNAILANLAERQVITDERLNALISTVERHVSNHH